jgi:hypothetical protein
MSSALKTSGCEELFGTGAVRDSSGEKMRPDLFSPFAEERVGRWLMLGAQRYAERNWEMGMPISRCWASLCRHKTKWQQGQRDEDHLAAIIFNAMAILHYEEMIKRGVLPAELDDMPKYKAPKQDDLTKGWTPEQRAALIRYYDRRSASPTRR